MEAAERLRVLAQIVAKVVHGVAQRARAELRRCEVDRVHVDADSAIHQPVAVVVAVGEGERRVELGPRGVRRALHGGAARVDLGPIASVCVVTAAHAP